jgi:hypothetical protein
MVKVLSVNWLTFEADDALLHAAVSCIGNGGIAHVGSDRGSRRCWTAR